MISQEEKKGFIIQQIVDAIMLFELLNFFNKGLKKRRKRSYMCICVLDTFSDKDLTKHKLGINVIFY